MKLFKKLLAAALAVTNVSVLGSNIPFHVSAERSSENSLLTEEQLAAAEEYIAADDRVGLYDFLRYEVYTDSPDGYLAYWMHGYTGTYILPENSADADSNYNMILTYYVYYDYEKSTPDEEPQPPLASKTIYGDANMDGKVSIKDILMLNKMCAGIITATNYEQAQLADIDGSYVIDIDDLTLLMQYTIGLVSIDSWSGEITYLSTETE